MSKEEYTLRGKSLSRIAEFICNYGTMTAEAENYETDLFTLIKDVVQLELEKVEKK